jgi:hypothetical protein
MLIRKILILTVAICSLGCATAKKNTVNSGDATIPAQPAVMNENPYMRLIDQSLYTPFISDSVGPLPSHVTVKVAQWGTLDGYEVIGYAEVQGDTIQDRIKNAEKYARAFGGDVIMPKGVTTREQLTNTFRDRATQGFLVWRKKPSPQSVPPITVIDVGGPRQLTPSQLVGDKDKGIKKNPEPLIQDITDKTPTGPTKEYPVYGKLPRVTYKKLLENNSDIKGQNFRGASLALKMYAIPDDLGIQLAPGQKMVMLATRSGENKLFLVIPSDREKWALEMIKSDKVFEFVYSPLGLYKAMFPVLQFVDDMK